MQVEFHRSGRRSYAVRVLRDRRPPLEMNPAPGFDDDMPHDLLHLVVEDELKLSRGIFGQLAAGGDAGTFHERPSASHAKREAARMRRRSAKRGAKLRADGRDEASLSERATHVCLYQWLARSADGARRRRARAMVPASYDHMRMPEEVRIVDDDVLHRVLARLDELSECWRSLEVGQCMTVEWPGRPGASSRRSVASGDRRR